MSFGFVGCKVGMICIFMVEGDLIFVIVLDVLDNCVMQIKIVEIDGYMVVQVVFGFCCVLCVMKLLVGYFVKVGVEVGEIFKEFCIDVVKVVELLNGVVVGVDFFEVGQKVDV